MKELIEQLLHSSSDEFFTRMRLFCEKNNWSRYMVDYSLNEAYVFIPGGRECLLLCVVFADKNEQIYISSSDYSLGEHKHSFSPVNNLKEKRTILELECRKYGFDTPRLFLGIAVECNLLNSDEERKQWKLKEGIDFVITGVNLSNETGKKVDNCHKISSLKEILCVK